MSTKTIRRVKHAPNVFGAWLLSFSLLHGCKADETRPRTEVLLLIDADRTIRSQAEKLTVELSSGQFDAPDLVAAEPEVFDLGADEFRWPASLALVARPGHEEHVFQVTISVEAAGETLARSRVRSAFVKNQTLLLKTSMFGACIGKLDCSPEQTCVSVRGAAQCISAVVDEKSLPSFVPGGDAGDLVADGGGGGPDAGSRNDASTPSDASMADADKPGDAEAGVDANRADTGATNEAGATPDGSTSDGSAADAMQPGCRKLGPEQCDNGLDDDCNGDIDCADSACTPMTTCAPAGSTVGVLVPEASPCPSGFSQTELALHQGLMDTGCSGCSCQATPATCTPQVYYYASTSACTLDAIKPYTGGTLINKSITATCSSEPIGDSQGMSTPVAWRVAMTVYPGSCNASGAATPLPPSWSTNTKLCTTHVAGGGCKTGFVCVPKVTTGKACGQKASAACPATTTAQTWHRSFTDNRSCDVCSCTATGGNCSNVAVQLGHDWSCNTIDGMLYGGEKSCNISTYSPPAKLSGLPTNPSCSASAAVSGMLLATSPLDLCCSD